MEYCQGDLIYQEMWFGSARSVTRGAHPSYQSITLQFCPQNKGDGDETDTRKLARTGAHVFLAEALRYEYLITPLPAKQCSGSLYS